jgi:hypothetical protein
VAGRAVEEVLLGQVDHARGRTGRRGPVQREPDLAAVRGDDDIGRARRLDVGGRRLDVGEVRVAAVVGREVARAVAAVVGCALAGRSGGAAAAGRGVGVVAPAQDAGAEQDHRADDEHGHQRGDDAHGPLAPLGFLGAALELPLQVALGGLTALLVRGHGFFALLGRTGSARAAGGWAAADAPRGSARESRWRS